MARCCCSTASSSPRITALTTQQLRRRGEQLLLRLGRDEIIVPEPLAGLLTTLARDGRRYVGVGSPATTWLFPDLLHLHPTTAVRWVPDAGGDWTDTQHK